MAKGLVRRVPSHPPSCPPPSPPPLILVGSCDRTHYSIEARARRAAPSPPSTAYFGIGNRDWGTRRTWKCPDKHRTATADSDRDRDRVVVHVFAAANERERPRIASSGASQSQSQRTQVLSCTYCMWIEPWLCASEKPFLASSERTHKILFSVLTPTVPP